VIKVSGDPGWPPFSAVDAAGQLQGLDVDLMNELAASAGLSIQWVVASNWNECVRLLKAGAVDVLVGTARTAEREEYLTFTRSYLDMPMAIIVRMESPFLNIPAGMQQMVAALPSGYVTSEFFERRYPHLPKSMTINVDQAFLYVARGDADYTVENIITANHMILNRGYSNLKIGGVMDTSFALRYAVRKDLAPLADILNRAMAAFPEVRKQELLAQWITVQGREQIDWRRIRNLAVVLVVVAGGVAGFFAYRNHLLDRELVERRRIQADLEEARRKLEDLNEEKNRFMTMAAHDLKNPLTSLLMTLDLLDRLEPGERRKEIDQATQTTHYMCALVRNLLDAHAIDQGALTVARTKVQLLPVLQRSIARSQSMAGAKQIRLESDFPRETREVQGDEEALSQVMDNLISNAIKFSPCGSRVRIAVRTLEEGFARVEVSDEGPGITEGDRPRLFERFSRLSARPTAGESSTGLGLSIVKRLVEAMGGTVGVVSGTEPGSTFYIDLPLDGATR
jgi:signal transduction histidine kinase